jgi:hydrogenase/urease accessory protein HupE
MARPAAADEFRPAYLQLSQESAETYSVLWKVPALNESTTLRISPLFPRGVRDISARRMSFASNMGALRWKIAAPGGLDGKSIAFPDLATTRIDILVRLERLDGTVQLERILPSDPQFTVRASPGPFEVMATYTKLGIEHILTGFDHLMFVLALIMIVRDLKRLLGTVTAFTLAHSITLALASLGVVHVPPPPVEATIALSIVFVASEIIQKERGHEGLAARKPWVVAFTFGLLHGLGFASALAEIGLPQNSIPLALLCFNVGVEIGQLIFITFVLTSARLAGWAFRGRIDRKLATYVPAYAIGAYSSYWVIERITKFWRY